MKVKRLAAAAVALAVALALAASGTARALTAATVHGYQNATAYERSAMTRVLKTGK